MPARDASGDADLTVGDPVGDGLPVATVGVTVAVKVGDAAPVGDGAPVATVGVTDTEKVEFCAVDSREDNNTRRRRRRAAIGTDPHSQCCQQPLVQRVPGRFNPWAIEHACAAAH